MALHGTKKEHKARSLCSNKLSPSMEERKFLQCWQKLAKMPTSVVIRHFNRNKEELLFELSNQRLKVDPHSKKRLCSCQTRSPSPSKIEKTSYLGGKPQNARLTEAESAFLLQHQRLTCVRLQFIYVTCEIVRLDVRPYLLVCTVFSSKKPERHLRASRDLICAATSIELFFVPKRHPKKTLCRSPASLPTHETTSTL